MVVSFALAMYLMRLAYDESRFNFGRFKSQTYKDSAHIVIAWLVSIYNTLIFATNNFHHISQIRNPKKTGKKNKQKTNKKKTKGV